MGIGTWIFISFQPRPTEKVNDSPNEQVDNTRPTIELSVSPASLQSIKQNKTLDVSANAQDNRAVIRVEYILDNSVVARSIESPLFKATINIAPLALGEHTLQAVAYDATGNKGTSQTFKFTIEPDETVKPTDEASQSLVRVTARKPPASTASISGGSGGDTSNPGTGDPTPNPNPDPDPDPDPDPEPGVRTAGGWWASLPEPMQVCTNAVWNDGPTAAPVGAITVPAGDNKNFNFDQDNQTFWFAPGVHTLGTNPVTDNFGGVVPGNNSTYIGAPGAILDGMNAVQYAFKDHATNVRIAYLEIRNFGRGNDNNNEGVINHDAGDNWTMEYLYAHNNDGAAVFLGSDNIIRNSCLKDNGQYGFSMYKPPVFSDSAIKNIVIDNNEISGNNQDDWENQIDGCGCTGGGKFWDVRGATVTNNYVHDNLSTGLWADTNDIDFLFDSNWIEHNSGEGIWYEVSYNATMSRNVLKRNAWETGNNNIGSPGPAIYISESGGDSRLPSTVSGSTDLRIMNNLMEDNFSGVSIYENSNRFCNSNGNTSKGYCTPFVTPTLIAEPHDYDYPNPISTTHPCYTQIANAPYTNDCRWHSKNVKVTNNEFRFNEANVPCAGTYCGVQALIATGSDNIPWAPSAYSIANVQNQVMHTNGNQFSNNTYHGNWSFAKGYGEKIYFDVWQAGPFSQDNGSTFDGAIGPPPTVNSLDTNTSTLEGSMGQWSTGWFDVTASRSNVDAHSGSYSLRLAPTAGGNWATDLTNYPGFPAGPGPKAISFWAKQGSGAVPTVTMVVKWFNSSGAMLQSNSLPLTLSTNWQQASTLSVTAPTGTTTAFVEFHGSSGGIGNTVFADDFIVGDQF